VAPAMRYPVRETTLLAGLAGYSCEYVSFRAPTAAAAASAAEVWGVRCSSVPPAVPCPTYAALALLVFSRVFAAGAVWTLNA
jgi:hypothetical protein